MKRALTAATAISAILCSVGPASAKQLNVNITPSAARIAPISAQRMDLNLNRTTDRQVNRDTGQGKQSALPKKRVASPKQIAGRKLVNPNLVKANQLRDAAQVRDAGEALRIPVTGGFGDDRFGDPLNPAGAGAPAADAAQTVARLRAMFGLGNSGLDWLGLLNGPLGGRSNQHHGSTFPGLVPDLNHVPGVSAQGDGEKGDERVADADGNIRTSTVRTDGEGNTTSVVKEVDPSGQVAVTKAVSQADGGYWSQTARSDGTTSTHIETASGLTRDIHTWSTGVQFIWDTGRNGQQSFQIRGEGGLDRTQTGEEGGGSAWCPPSGWGCSGPMNAADIIAGGTRSQPDPEAQPMVAPSLGMNPLTLVVNPNPDEYATGGGSSGPMFNPCPDCEGDGRGER